MTDRSSRSTTRAPVRTIAPSRSSWRRADGTDPAGTSAGSGPSPRRAGSARLPCRSSGSRGGACRGRSRRALRRAPRRSARRRRARTTSTPRRRAGSCSRSAASKAMRIRRRISSRVVERLQAGRVAGPVVVAEVREARPGGDDQRVVRDRAAVGEHDLASLDVEADRLAEEDRRVPLAAEDRPQRLGDVAGRHRAGRDLVEQRREQVVVAPVDERDHRRDRHDRGPWPPTGHRTRRRR